MRHLLTLLVAIPLIAYGGQSLAKAKHATEYKSPGKPSMKVEMDYSVSKKRVAVGETVDISINFSGKEMPNMASLKTSQELVLHGNDSINLQKTGSQASHKFSVTPMTEGIHIISVIAEDAQQSHKKPFAIRIIAGDKPIEEYLQKNGTLEVDESGKRIISMPAVQR